MLIKKAYELAKSAHEGQKRESSEDYISHPLNVALVLADFHLDVETYIAALLHDVVEDTKVPIEKIKKEFGENIAFLVNAGKSVV